MRHCTPSVVQGPARWLTLACLASGLSATPGAWAESADRLQPMQIEADAMHYDDKQQLSVFKGNVVLSKGTILIRGQQLDVRQDAQGNPFGAVKGANGERALFRQKREGLNEFIEGQAQDIRYNGQANTVELLGQATLRRLRGNTVYDESHGSRIVYNNNTETFSIDGRNGQATPDNPGGRVRAVITPTPTASEAAPAPQVQLRSSISLQPKE